MIASSRVIRSLTPRWVAERLPPAWFFSQTNAGWMRDVAYVQQFPTEFRVAFGVISRLGTGASRGSRNHLARGLFLAAKTVHQARSRLGHSRFLEFSSDRGVLCVDLHDSRFLMAIAEHVGNAVSVGLAHLLQPGDCFIDIGANHGTFCLAALRHVGKTGRVVAFEPQPNLANAVRESLRQSGHERWEVHAIALGDDDSSCRFYVPKSFSGGAGVLEAYSGTRKSNQFEVDVRRLDGVLRASEFERHRVVIKLDVEGSELRVIRGATEFFRKVKPVLVMEVNKRALESSGASVEIVIDQLAQLGYRRFRSFGGRAMEGELVKLGSVGHQNVILDF